MGPRRAPGGTVGEATAFAEVYRRERTSMVQLAWLLTRDAGVAEDVAQDAFTALFRAFDRVEHPAAYLRRSVVNGVFMRTRQRVREERRNTLVMAGSPVTVDGPTGGVADAMATLSMEQKTAVVLRYWAGLSDREIAEAMGVRPGTARSHLSRAAVRLRRELA